MTIESTDATAEDSLKMWERELYGEAVQQSEKRERELVVRTLLNCHTELVRLATYPPPVDVQKMTATEKIGDLLINEACGDLLNSVSKILHIDRDKAQHTLLDISIWERNQRIWDYVQAAR